MLRLLAFALALSLPVAATDWYVAPDGSPTAAGTIGDPTTLDRACGTTGTPWASIGASDTLILRGGTYPGLTSGNFGSHPCWLSGTPNMAEDACDSLLTIRAYPGELPVLDNQTGLRPHVLTLFGDCVHVIGVRATSSDEPTRRSDTYSSNLVITSIAVASNVATVTLQSSAPYTILAGSTAVMISGATVDTDLNTAAPGTVITGVTSQSVFTVGTTNVADGNYNEGTLRLSGYLQHFSCYPTCRPHGVVNLGKLNCFIAGYIDNTGQGWTSENNTEGSCLKDTWVFANGWQGPNRGHGHGVYLQNAAEPRKVTSGNIISWNVYHPLHPFGVSGATRYMDFDDNVTFGNGRLADRFNDDNNDGFNETNIGTIATSNLLGGPDPLDVKFRNNIFHNPSCATLSANDNFHPSFTVAANTITVTGNYSQGCDPVDWASNKEPVNSTFSGNEWYGTIQSHVSAYLSSDTKNTYDNAPLKVKEHWFDDVPERGWVTFVNAPGSTIEHTFACNGRVELRNEMNPFGAAVATHDCGVPVTVSLTYSGAMIAVSGGENLPHAPDEPVASFRTFLLTQVDSPVGRQRSGSRVRSGNGSIQ